MGAKQHVTTEFTKDNWLARNDSGTVVPIGSGEGASAPYDLLLSALSGCLYITFESVLEKMQIKTEKTVYDISGEKRDDKIATLKVCHVAVTVYGAQDKDKTEKAMDIAARYCSIYNTLSKVADMSWSISFAD